MLPMRFFRNGRSPRELASLFFSFGMFGRCSARAAFQTVQGYLIARLRILPDGHADDHRPIAGAIIHRIGGGG
jgi:hypothetical protein